MADYDVRGFDDDGANHTNDFNSVTDEGWFVPADFTPTSTTYPFFLKHYNTAESAEIGATGTGLFNPFLNMNGDATLLGFNTDDDIKKPHTDAGLDISDPNTDSIKLGDIPIVYLNLDGLPGLEAYYLINLDINENVNSEVSLEELQIFTSSASATLADYHFDEGAALAFASNGGDPATDFTLRFDLDSGGDNELLLRDDGAGQGKLDYTFYLPVSLFAGASPNDYLTLFSQFGPTPPDDAGFAEWNTLVAAKISGTKFNDKNGDGVRDLDGVDNIAGNSDDEVGLAGFTVYIDINGNNKLDANEQTALTDATGHFEFASLLPNASYTIREVLTAADVNGPADPGTDVNFADYDPPAGIWTQTTDPLNDGDQIVNVTTGTATMLIGNHILVPAIHLEKGATIAGGSADAANEVIHYTLDVTNPGDIPLTGIVITDPYADAGSIQPVTVLFNAVLYNSGDANHDNKLDLTETWHFTATHTVTQAELNNNGGGDGVLENTATVTSDQGVSDDDNASVPVDQNPGISIDKLVHDVDGDTTAPEVDAAGDIVNYTIGITNTGNVTLTGLLTEDQVEALAGTSLAPVEVGGFNTGDTNSNDEFDPGETWNFTASYTVTQDDIDGNGGGNGILSNIAKATTTQTSTVSDDADVPIVHNPAIAIDKVAALDDGGDCVDEDGDIIRYTYSVTNAGNVALDNVVVVDDKVTVVADDADTDGFNDGDLDEDGLLDLNETWTYTASYTATQDDIDNAGDGDGFIHNTVTANGEAAVSGIAAPEASDSEQVEVCQLPGVSIVKNVRTDTTGGVYVPADDLTKPQSAIEGSPVDFEIILTNTGNVTLTGITLQDVLDGGNLDYNTVNGGGDAHVEIDADGDGIYEASGSWTDFAGSDQTLDLDLGPDGAIRVTYSYESVLGNHVNVVTVTDDQAVSDDNEAGYYVLESEDCVGVRTPGFWANPKWGTFWDGVADNQPKQAGTPGFAIGELLYAVDSDGVGGVNPMDSNGDGFINAIAKDGVNDTKPLDTTVGLLIGDYNKNGITDPDEDTIFISIADAKTLIDASNKQLNGNTGDGMFMLGRDVVAAWLNYLANNPDDDTGNCIGDANGGATNTPREFLDAAIDWLQQFASTSNSDDTASNTDTNTNTSFHDGNLWAKFEFDAKIAPSSAAWQNPFTTGEDIPVSAAAMHSAIDGYNNTGMINGIEFCCDADSPLVLNVLAQIV